MERDEAEQMLLMFAGIALPGIIGRSGMFDEPKYIAKQAFNIADAMMDEYINRTNKEEQDECASSNNTETAPH